YGTPLFSTWAGIGAWVFGTAFVGRADYPKRALIVACLMALGLCLPSSERPPSLDSTSAREWAAATSGYAIRPCARARRGRRVGPPQHTQWPNTPLIRAQQRASTRQREDGAGN